MRRQATDASGQQASQRSRLIVLALGIVGVTVGCVLLGYPGLAAVAQWRTPRGIAIILLSAYVLFWVIYCCVSRSSLRTKLARWVLTTTAFLLPLLLAESLVYFRLVDFNWVFQGATHPVGKASLNSKWWRLDNELIHIRYPNMHITGRTRGDIAHRMGMRSDRYYTIDAKYDANGFRNERQLVHASVAVLGDSFVEAGLVPARQLFTRRMSDQLGVPVSNLGVTMYGPQQELAVLRRYGIPLEPQVVVWMFFEGNDLSNAVLYPEHLKAAQRQFDSFTRRSFSRNILAKMAELSRMAMERTDLQLNSCEVTIQQQPHRIFFRYVGTPLQEQDLAGLSLVKETIEQAKQLCDNAHAELLFVFVPTKFRVYEEIGDFSSGRGDAPAKFEPWRSNELPEQLSKWTADSNIEFLDLTPALKTAASEQLLYFSDDSHWNSDGHEVVARELADLIAKRGWVAGVQ